MLIKIYLIYNSEELVIWWYDPRTGNSFRGDTIAKAEQVIITAPTTGKGHDWVLVLDTPSLQFEAPGKTGYHD